MSQVQKYGLLWETEDWADYEIELDCIRRGGRWTFNGEECGAGLFEHYRNFFSLAWPEDHHNRWSDLILNNLVTNRITVVQGPKNSQKTRTTAKWALTKYWASPTDTQVLLTSTDRRGLQMRILGDIKSLFERAHRFFPKLQGNFVEAHDAIFTDDILTGRGSRDWRRGIIGVPILSSTGDFNGMAIKNFAGLKADHRVLVGDELQFIPVEYLKVLASLDDGDFSAGLLGNPIGGNGKALDKVAEPECGWFHQKEPTKTTTWKNKYGGMTIQLVGTDSPNFDKPLLVKYPKLIDPIMADSIAAMPGGKDSLEWWSLIMGIRKVGVVSNKVLTVDMVENKGGFGDCVWDLGQNQKGLAVDAGYGGDACVATPFELGEVVGHQSVMRFGIQEVIPVLVSSKTTPEVQIAEWIRDYCRRENIPDSHVAIEAGMRATLALECGKLVGNGIHVVLAGGVATPRPVNNNLFITDTKTGLRRLKTCYEHYSKFVTEMAFSVRELVMGGQARNFPRQAADEFEQREWEFVYGDRYELETKDDYKKRNSVESPNYSDSVAIAVELARRMGFVLERIRDGADSLKKPERDWLEAEIIKQKRIDQEAELVYD